MSAIDTIRQVKQPGAAFGNRVKVILVGFWRTVGFLIDRRRSRLDLLELTDDQLKDIGISRVDAYREAHRSILAPIQFQSQSDWKRSL